MHAIKVCKHGKIVSRCRCIGPHTTVVVPCPESCKETDHVPKHVKRDED